MERVLFLTREFPFPANHGGKIRDYQILRALSEHREIELVCFKSPENQFREPVVPDHLKIAKVSVIPCTEAALQQALQEAKPRCSILWASQSDLACYMKAAKSMGYSLIWDANAVQSKIIFENAFRSLWTLGQIFKAIGQLLNEKKAGRIAKLVVVSSEIEAFRMRRLAPAAKIRVIPNCVDIDHYEEARTKKGATLFFSGSLDHFPNIQAMNWFVEEILPRLKGALGDALPEIVVAGSNPSSELSVSLKKAGITVQANPASVLPYLEEAAVVFVPIRSGGGTRFKILEAMAAGKPVVSTGKGAEGLELAPCFNIWIADSPDPFAKHIVKLLQNAQLRAETGTNGLKHIENRYDWACIRQRIAEISFLAGNKT